MVETLDLIRKLQRAVAGNLKAEERAEALELLDRLVELVVLSEYDGRADG